MRLASTRRPHENIPRLFAHIDRKNCNMLILSIGKFATCYCQVAGRSFLAEFMIKKILAGHIFHPLTPSPCLHLDDSFGVYN